jgi:hypothetical protein
LGIGSRIETGRIGSTVQRKKKEKELRIKWTIPFLLYTSLTSTYGKMWDMGVGIDEEGLQCEEVVL